tara:strand:- start:7353 stop:7544 length:192 start_codon:yes stop_codon:yes gene_type:complete
MRELKYYINKKIAFHYSDYDKELMNMNSNHFEVFVGTHIKDDLLWNNDYQWIDLKYAKKNLIN